MKNFFSSKYLFILGLIAYLLLYGFFNYGADLDSISSDVWNYQFFIIQEKEQPWNNVPETYHGEELYAAYPILYHASPGFDKGLVGYHALALIIIITTYLISGLITFKLFKNWPLATLAGLLVLIPRHIFPTRIGIIGLGNVRGNAFAFPLYFLLSYYWIIYGLQDRKKNFWLAIAAGLLVYLYPPVGTIIVGLSVLGAALLNLKDRTRLKQISLFILIYFVVSFPFWVNHFSNPAASMLNTGENLSSPQTELHSEILQYRFRANAFLSTIDIARTKRSIWDGSPLLILFILGLYYIRKKRNILSAEQYHAHTISLTLLLLLVVFVLGVELINVISIRHGGFPVFIEHLRLMRFAGFILVMETILFLYILIKENLKKTATLISAILIVTPIVFFAPVIRPVVRVIIPESIRTKYNLAPAADDLVVRDFKNLKDVAEWTKENISPNNKFFVFDDFQNEFRFKVLSRRDTNLTAKEGAAWVTANHERAVRWYEERQKYNEVTQNAKDFSEITQFARELGSTHVLLPRGKFLELYKKSSIVLRPIYENPDYQILEL